jgi:broad specificity phosphatase PhoE
MATVILVRHGRTTANATGVLAGRTKGVLLDEIGRAQAAATGERLAAVPLAGVVSRTSTAAKIAHSHVTSKMTSPSATTDSGRAAG